MARMVRRTHAACLDDQSVPMQLQEKSHFWRGAWTIEMSFTYGGIVHSLHKKHDR
jgi:hypothetical protein